MMPRRSRVLPPQVAAAVALLAALGGSASGAEPSVCKSDCLAAAGECQQHADQVVHNESSPIARAVSPGPLTESLATLPSGNSMSPPVASRGPATQLPPSRATRCNGVRSATSGASRA